MDLFSSKRKQARDDIERRKGAGLQTAWRSTGIHPAHLSYEETPGTNRAVVRDTRTGKVVQRQRLS